MADDPLANIEITPREVKDMMDRGEKFLFVDVREKWEFDTSWIQGAVLVPMREIPANLAKFEEDVTLIGMKMQSDAVIGHIVGATQVFQTRERIAPGNDRAAVVESEALP